MPILNIEPVSRRGMRLLVSLYGLSETGKTLSAVRLACGIEPDPRKRLLLDSEGGQRGRAYVDHVSGGYMYAALTPPFTPERYIEAVGEIEAAGITTMVIDSISHVWAAEGGILDMVEVASEKNDLAKWAKPKRRLGKMTRRLLSSDLHIILCARAKQPLLEEIVDGRKKLVLGPVVPIQEKTLRYDLTIIAHMLGDGRFTVAAPAGKCPGVLRDIFSGDRVMDEDMGRKLVDWVGAQTVKSPELRQLEIAGNEAAEQGAKAFVKWWNSPAAKDFRPELQAKLGNYQSIAKAADAERERIAAEEGDRSALEEPFARAEGSGKPLDIIGPGDARSVAPPADATDWHALADEMIQHIGAATSAEDLKVRLASRRCARLAEMQTEAGQQFGAIMDMVDELSAKFREAA